MKMRAAIAAALLVLAALTIAGLGLRKSEFAPTWLAAPLAPPRVSGEVVFLTLRGPTTTQHVPKAGLSDEEAQTGFEHDLAVLFAQEIGARARFRVMPSYARLMQQLQENRGHIAAAGLSPSPELRQSFAFGPSYKTIQYQIIYRQSETRPRTMNDAAGKKVAAVADTPAHDILRDLTGSFPRFQLEALPHAAHPDELLKAVNDKQVDYALVDAFAFAVTKRLYPDLAVAFNVGRETKVAWAFSNAADYDLQQSAVRFFDKIRGNGTLNRLMDRYYGHIGRMQPIDAETMLERIRSVLPRLRNHFLEAQQLTGIDWRVLAAVGYQESQWDPLATSPTGVRGIMMLTEDTADRMKVKNRLDARESIVGGARYLAMLRDTVPARIAEPDRTWLALAAYNQGYGHLEDARILAARMKLNPDAWLDVRKAYPRLSDPEVYESLRHGYCRGEEAVHFVERVRNFTDVLTRMERAADTNLRYELHLDAVPNAARGQDPGRLP